MCIAIGRMSGREAHLGTWSANGQFEVSSRRHLSSGPLFSQFVATSSRGLRWRQSMSAVGNGSDTAVDTVTHVEIDAVFRRVCVVM